MILYYPKNNTTKNDCHIEYLENAKNIQMLLVKVVYTKNRRKSFLIKIYLLDVFISFDPFNSI